jgi:2-amino-4-hydroxy-6-hydroxymethyldihydropteridine diphosphokinase
MNTAIVMLGSNMNKEENMELVKIKLADYFEIIDQSKIIESEPVGEKYKNSFLNQAIKILSDDTAEQTAIHFKHIETEMGRSATTSKKGDVPIDIDLIFWNKELKRNDYTKYDFVKICVDEIKDNIEFTT